MTNQTNINEPLGKLRAIESQLCTLLVEREEVVRTALLALLCKENLVVVGPPGTAKSQLITQLAQRVGDASGNGHPAGAATPVIHPHRRSRGDCRDRRRRDRCARLR